MTKRMRPAALGTALAAVAWATLVAPAAAQDPRVVNPERYIPGVWIDPDGCEHWAMDDGTEMVAEAGDITSLPSGHDAWVVGDEPVVVVDWYGASNYAKG